MLYNFIAHETERDWLGVRFLLTRNDGSFEPHEFWCFCRMCFCGQLSPVDSCQGQLRIHELCKGDRKDPRSTWQWNRVHLNLFTDFNFDCLVLRVVLLWKGGELLPKEVMYMDDTHVYGRDTDIKCTARGSCHQIMLNMNLYEVKMTPRSGACRLAPQGRGMMLSCIQTQPSQCSPQQSRSGGFFAMGSYGCRSPTSPPTS